MNRKRFGNVFATALLAGFLAACSSSNSSEEQDESEQAEAQEQEQEPNDDRTSTSSWWSDHFAGYWYILKRDGTDLYRSVDRHLFNYDWEDPYIN